MATQGNSKRSSALQKAHYQAYLLVNRRLSNKIKRLKRRIRLNEKMIVRKAKRNPPRVIKIDSGAVDALRALTS